MTVQFTSWEQALLLRAHEQQEPAPAASFADEGLLQRAYAHCEELTAQHSRSFHLASGLLPPDKRRAVRALYAFCRVTDDIVDNPTEEIQVGLARWRHKVLAGHYTAEDLVAVAWSDARTRYRVPAAYMRQLVDGVARDLEQKRYATFEDLATYAYGVASTVGLMSMHIIGFGGRDAVPYAIKLGVALQITNILRDVGSDWQMGRVYLPHDELAAFDIDDAYLARGVVDNRWRAFMRFQIARNRRLYEEAWPGIQLLNPDGRFSIAAAADLYGAILDDIERHDFDVFNRRAYVSTWGKLIRLPGLWWRTAE